MVEARLSVVIPAFNAARYIEDCIESVLRQTDAPPFEIVVVDDGSTDGTAALIRKRFPALRLIEKANGGPGSARNVGVDAAQGDVVVFIDADDLMLPGRLAHQGGFMLENPGIGMTFGKQQTQWVPALDEDRTVCGTEDYAVLPGIYEDLLVRGNFIPNTACAVRRDVYIASGGQPETFFVGEDYAMNCAIAREWPVAATRRFLTWYRQGHGGNLLASPHTYEGPVVAVLREVEQYADRLSPEARRLALQRARRLFTMYLRWLWIDRSRRDVLAALDLYGHHFGPGTTALWRTLSLMPPTVGRAARTLRRRMIRRKVAGG